MKLHSDVHHHAGKSAAVRPVNVFEVQLDPNVTALLTGGHEPLGHGLVGRSIRKQLMNVFLRKCTVDDDRHDGDMVPARRFEDDRIGTTRDQAIRIYGIPGGNENVDFVGMSQEGPYGLGLTRQVEKGLRLFSLYRETKKDDRDQNGE